MSEIGPPLQTWKINIFQVKNIFQVNNGKLTKDKGKLGNPQ